MNIKKAVGNRVRELRHSVGLSQEKLALNAGIDRTYINSVENGRRNPSIESIRKICDGLDISLRIFFKSDLFGKEA